MNNNPSDLMSYCSWVKKNLRYRESVGESFCGFTFYNREHFAFREPIGDTLTTFLPLRIRKAKRLGCKRVERAFTHVNSIFLCRS